MVGRWEGLEYFGSETGLLGLVFVFDVGDDQQQPKT